MAPIIIADGVEIDDELQVDFAVAACYVLALTAVCASVTWGWPLYEAKGKTHAVVPSTIEGRIDAAEKLLLSPLFAVVGGLACRAAWELRGSVETRWHGETWCSRWCGLLYCAKMAIDVPVQTYTLRKTPRKRAEMVGHHFLSLVAIGLGLVVKRCGFFACLAVCSELSTPFLNAVFALKLLGGLATPAQRLAHKASGVLLWLMYIPFRLVNFPVWLWLWYADQREDPARTTDACTAFELAFFPAVIALLLVLSSTWFVAITKGLVRGLRGGAKKA